MMFYTESDTKTYTTMKLTNKQKRFVEEYLIDLNATQAAIRAGYKFSEDLSEAYVYFLIDPRDNKIFYVGKGRRKRISCHVRDAKNGSGDNGIKNALIMEILSSGHVVKEVVFASGFNDKNALLLERVLIRSLRDYGLTNIAQGSVPSSASVSAKAAILLSKLKTYDEWIKTAGEESIAMVLRLFGSTKVFYGDIQECLIRCRDGMPFNLNSIKGKSNGNAWR